MQRYPKIEKILELATSPTDSIIREKALKYFLDNFDEIYFKSYNSASINVAFLPCSNSKTYVRPSGCFANAKCSILGFLIIREDLISYAIKFGVRSDPSIKEVLNKLAEKSQDENNAIKENCNYAQVIEYIISISVDLNEEEKKLLRTRTIWPKENSFATTNIRDLYEPTILHRELGLPIFDWKGIWSNSSKQGNIRYYLIHFNKHNLLIYKNFNRKVII